ncbi:MAG: 3-hydroxyacyl-CoA dehydrogenase family protein [Thermomicrobiales bacterium]
MNEIVVVGAGLMGAQIGCEYAMGGHRVVFVARNPMQARERIASALVSARDAGLIDAGDLAAVEARMRVESEIGVVSADVGIVVESIVEELDAKGAVLAVAAARWPAATLASNTSSISITELGARAGADERIIGVHYWNPPLLMPLVEVIRGRSTDPARVTEMVELLTGMGKRPVLVERDVPGFVWNRLQLALIREAAWIADEGVASPAVIDEIVRDGLARRWRLTGPFETMALGGATTFQRIALNLFPVLSERQDLDGVDRHLLTDPERLAEIKGRRDAGLREELRREKG